MSRALFVSPHLDDVAFSCGATFAALARAGWDCTLLTCFTASVPGPRGFALRCQTDKGIPPAVDYLALRRREDRRAAALLGAADVVHLDLPEAPHRGYEAAEQLFAGVREGDGAWRDLAALLPAPDAFDLVLLPQGLGRHVDHLQVVRATEAAGLDGPRYADLPYALREPGGDHGEPLPVDVEPGDVAAKLDACAAYASQLAFQFGGEAAMRRALGAAPERFAVPARPTVTARRSAG